MGEFYGGWKRKVGLLTLVMALALMSAWLRSLGRIDEITIPFGTVGSALIISTDGCFVCTWSMSPADAEAHWETTPFSGIEELGAPDVDEVEPATENKVEQPFFPEWLTHSFVGMSFVRVGIDEHRLVPYFPFVASLTLISLWLLLSKPRKSTSKKTAEPSANEEATS